MGVSSFDELMAHVGHTIICTTYGKHGKPPWANVALECEDCSTVLLDFDKKED